MKSRIASYLAGVLTVVLIGTFSVSALASDGALTLTAHPIHILVNGEVFQPKDAAGNDALVFVYNGTTYAPLRALAESYGLEVGYDAASNTATVTGTAGQKPAAPADDFISQWTVKEKPVTNYGDEKIFTVNYSGSLGTEDFKAWWKSFDMDYIKACAEQIAAEAQSLHPGYKVTAYFNYGSQMLGTAYAFGDYEQSNFKLAGVWIK